MVTHNMTKKTPLYTLRAPVPNTKMTTARAKLITARIKAVLRKELSLIITLRLDINRVWSVAEAPSAAYARLKAFHRFQILSPLLGRITRAVEILDLLLKVRLGILDGLVVDGRSEFLHEEVQKETGFQVPDLLVMVLEEIRLDGRDQFLATCFG
jgi:hypothetical protein